MEEEDEHSPSEFCYPEELETFDVETETGITECLVINNLLTELARAVLGNIGPWSWQYGPRPFQYSPVRPSRSVSKPLLLMSQSSRVPRCPKQVQLQV